MAHSYSEEELKLSTGNNNSLIISFVNCMGLGGKGKGDVEAGAGE